MKKLLSKLGIFSLVFLMASCDTASSKENNKEATSSENTIESSEVVTGASEYQYTDTKEIKESYDVIIVGAGGAGMAAAIQAKEAGANPVIFEKLPIAGGNTLKSSGGMNASDTKFQKEQGIDDNNDLFFEDTFKGGQETNDKELLRYLVDNSADAIDWLDNLGITLNNISYSGGASVKRIHRPEDGSAVGGYLVDGLIRNVTERKIPIFVNSDVGEINVKDGEVTGVEVTIDGEKKNITSKSVIVTTGGFGFNEEMIVKHRPDLKGYVSTNSEGSTGDGITMIEKLGGQMVAMDQIQVHPTVIQDSGMLISETIRGEGAILVNNDGLRFTDELQTRDKVSEAITNLPEQNAYLIFDDELATRAKQVEFYKEQGEVLEAETIEELAQQIDIPENNLKNTLDTWNEAVLNEKDNGFGRETAMDYNLEKKPFYAIKIAPGIHHTMGGVKINTKTQVIGENNQEIPGLYASGEVTGGLHGNNRIGGNAVADIIIFGRQAGRQSADYAANN